eukprot:4789449-Amphidinium_carterae.1
MEVLATSSTLLTCFTPALCAASRMGLPVTCSSQAHRAAARDPKQADGQERAVGMLGAQPCQIAIVAVAELEEGQLLASPIALVDDRPK